MTTFDDYIQAVVDDGPSGYWTLAENGGTYVDLVAGVAAEPHGNVTRADDAFGAGHGAASFDGRPGTYLESPNGAWDSYSLAVRNALTVELWWSPAVLDFTHTSGSRDAFVMTAMKGSGGTAEWGFRLYNATNPTRHSRTSFYSFRDDGPSHLGNGGYMEHGVSAGMVEPIAAGRWYHSVGVCEPWRDRTDEGTGVVFHLDGVAAARSRGDKYNNAAGGWHVVPTAYRDVVRLGAPVSGDCAFDGRLAHFAIYQTMLPAERIAEHHPLGRALLAS